tara:strand:- start:979 stop:1800 length:822 start_codon:yes stop_codon:yes gene_type:complete
MKDNLFQDFLIFFSKIFKTMFLFFLAGILAGILYDEFKRPYYETKAIATSGLSYFEGVVTPKDFTNPIIDQKEIINIINSLSPVIESRDHKLLAAKLNLDLAVVNEIIMLEAEQLYEIDSENRRQKLSYFEITLKSYSNNVIEEFEKGLVSYIANNSYVKDYYDFFITQTPFLISEIDKELMSLQIARNNDIANQYSVSVANNKSELMQNQIIDLYEKKLDMEKKLNLLSPLSFVQSFNVYSNPKRRGFFRIFVFSFISLVFGFCFSVYKEFK